MAFPTLKPSSRTFDAGDWPVKTFRSQNGSETRILYGSNRTGMSLQLSYNNIADADAELFLDHYNEVQGTYGTFTLSTGVRSGWAGNTDALGAAASGNTWRYADAPQVQSVKPGISSVQIKLVGVL